ncbi:MAG: helix-turn-helix domain-containing protein [Planctomycetes bacterium]|nr:helix-turn-helix domain-containing protein [Planctomycetota bacterium]
MNAVTEGSAVLDTEQVAQLLQCSPNHVRALVRRGELIAPVRLGALVRWPRALVLEWLNTAGRSVRGGRIVESR